MNRSDVIQGGRPCRHLRRVRCRFRSRALAPGRDQALGNRAGFRAGIDPGYRGTGHRGHASAACRRSGSQAGHEADPVVASAVAAEEPDPVDSPCTSDPPFVRMAISSGSAGANGSPNKYSRPTNGRPVSVTWAWLNLFIGNKAEQFGAIRTPQIRVGNQVKSAWSRASPVNGVRNLDQDQ